MFEIGSKVRFRSGRWTPSNDLPEDGVLTIGAVVPLPKPDDYYVDPFYWDTSQYAWAREKTRLEIAGHPQIVFLEGIPELTSLPKYPPDPNGMGRRAFSGAWFEQA